MANYYEALLVPTDVDNERLQQRYHHIRDAEGRWPVYPYYPMDLDYFRLAYQELYDPAKRAAHDLEFNIVPQKASFSPCLEWTQELASETAGQGSTLGPHFAHIGIANLLDRGQVDFINGIEVRRTRDERLFLHRPDDGSVKTILPYRIALPGCTADIDYQHILTVWWKNQEGEVTRWSYQWKAETNEWFERPVGPQRSGQAGTKYYTPDFSKLSGVDYMAQFRCPICCAIVISRFSPIKCSKCDIELRRCFCCFRLTEKEEEHQIQSCLNCGYQLRERSPNEDDG